MSNNHCEAFEQKLDNQVNLIKNEEMRAKIQKFINNLKIDRRGDSLIGILADEKCKQFITFTAEQLNKIKI